MNNVNGPAKQVLITTLKSPLLHLKMFLANNQRRTAKQLHTLFHYSYH